MPRAVGRAMYVLCLCLCSARSREMAIIACARQTIRRASPSRPPVRRRRCRHAQDAAAPARLRRQSPLKRRSELGGLAVELIAAAERGGGLALFTGSERERGR